jgi:hypothetical protein
VTIGSIIREVTVKEKNTIQKTSSGKVCCIIKRVCWLRMINGIYNSIGINTIAKVAEKYLKENLKARRTDLKNFLSSIIIAGII